MDDEDILPLSTVPETALDVAAAISSIAPWVGGPISAVLTGMSLTRKLDRVKAILLDMANQIKDVKSNEAEEYVKTDEFQELLEKTLRQAAEERSEEKRRAYASFLAGDVKSPGQPYEEKIRILRHLEEIQANHIRMLKALMQAPDYNSSLLSGSISQTLQRRLPDIPMDRIRDLAQQLTDMRLADLTNLNTMMTARGAEELQNRITAYGLKFIAYTLSGT
jgi:dsDNA-binding SOS-regulon protein